MRECKYRNTNEICLNEKNSENCGCICIECDPNQDGRLCNNLTQYADSTEERLYFYLRLEQGTYEKIMHGNYDAETKKHLKAIYRAKIELLQELIKELY